MPPRPAAANQCPRTGLINLGFVTVCKPLFGKDVLMAARFARSLRRIFGQSTMLVLVLTCLSCSQRGSVSGTVQLNGKPLEEGTVIFHCPHGVVLRAAIAKNGDYSLADVPVGPAQITVVARPARPWKRSTEGAPVIKDPKGGRLKRVPEESKAYVPIPRKYRDPEKSGLTHTVESGSQTKNIDLVGSDE
jgi:hypothetical protein